MKSKRLAAARKAASLPEIDRRSRDLRTWIADLEDRKDLNRIAAEVDWDEEIGAITREVSSRGGPALLFEEYQGPSRYVLSAALHQRHRHARACRRRCATRSSTATANGRAC